MSDMNKIVCAHALPTLRTMSAGSVDLVMTSPPYYSHKEYDGDATIGEWDDGFKGRLGHEKTVEQFITHLVDVFRECKRVLKPTGSFFLNMGDTYSTGREMKGIPAQNRLLVPSRLAIALIEDGWILRNDIIWYKPNHRPESVKTRLTTSFEYLFHFTKSSDYYYNLDAIREPHNEKWLPKNLEARPPRLPSGKAQNTKDDSLRQRGHSGYFGKDGRLLVDVAKGKNPGDVWRIKIEPYRGPHHHFAVFPLQLCYRPIMATCPPGGIVLDPFAGTGTVAEAVEILNREDMTPRPREFPYPFKPNSEKSLLQKPKRWIMIEVVPAYGTIIKQRLKKYE